MKIYLALISLTLTAHAAQSIDCKKTGLGASENTVCSTPQLLKIDSRMMSDLDLLNTGTLAAGADPRAPMDISGNMAHRRDVVNNWLQALRCKLLQRNAIGAAGSRRAFWPYIKNRSLQWRT